MDNILKGNTGKLIGFGVVAVVVLIVMSYWDALRVKSGATVSKTLNQLGGEFLVLKNPKNESVVIMTKDLEFKASAIKHRTGGMRYVFPDGSNETIVDANDFNFLSKLVSHYEAWV